MSIRLERSLGIPFDFSLKQALLSDVHLDSAIDGGKSFIVKGRIFLKFRLTDQRLDTGRILIGELEGRQTPI